MDMNRIYSRKNKFSSKLRVNATTFSLNCPHRYNPCLVLTSHCRTPPRVWGLQNDRQYEIAKPYAQTAVNWLAIRAALHFIGPPLRRSHTPEEDADPVREFTGYLRDFQKVGPVRRQKSARLCAFPR